MRLRTKPDNVATAHTQCEFGDGLSQHGAEQRLKEPVQHPERQEVGEEDADGPIEPKLLGIRCAGIVLKSARSSTGRLDRGAAALAAA